ASTVPITIKHMVNGKLLTLNGGQPCQHTLPSRTVCVECHEENGTTRQTFIGFDEARLNSKLPTATKTQLTALGETGMFMKPVTTTPETITDTSNDMGRMLRIKRFVFGNCLHCHNGSKVVDLAPDMFVQNTVNMETMSQSVKPPMG